VYEEDGGSQYQYEILDVKYYMHNGKKKKRVKKKKRRVSSLASQSQRSGGGASEYVMDSKGSKEVQQRLIIKGTGSNIVIDQDPSTKPSAHDTIKILEKHITPNFKNQGSSDGTTEQKVLKLKRESIKLVTKPY